MDEVKYPAGKNISSIC